MSLLMDALRKAEEAKKKAAQENKPEEATPTASAEKQQASAAVGKAPKDHSASETKLSMEAIEEVPARSAVPNLETPDEFEDEDDYVLPTSVRSAEGSVADSIASLEQSLFGEDEPSVELGQNNLDVEKHSEVSPVVSEMDLEDSPAASEPEKHQEPKARHKDFNFDSFESAQDDTTTNEETAPDKTSAAVSSAEKSSETRSPRVVVKVVEQAREQAQDRDGPGRKTARSVFAAKKSPLLKKLNVRVAAGSALALVIVVFAAYFYISLNQESTFNIPPGSYATTEFVDDAAPSETDGNQLAIDVVIVAEGEETTAIDIIGSAPEQFPILGGPDVVTGDVTTAPLVAGTLIESPSLQITAVPEASRSVATLQPETIVDEVPQPEAVTTTSGDTPAAIIESEIVDQPVASIGVQSAALVEPTNLISFRKQESVPTIDPNVDRAYAAYRQGSFDQAEMLYRQTLAVDPRQRDALLGLANITARNGNSTEALDLYSRLLARNPSDPIARAGLMELLPAGSPSEQEAELKRLINDHPDVAALSYAYGNFLAFNQRWPEAQQAYFRALQLAKSNAVLYGLVNPDYAFNLAVSLEHLNQSEPAQNYYREALNYSENHPAGFDLTAVRSRLANMAGNRNDE